MQRGGRHHRKLRLGGLLVLAGALVTIGSGGASFGSAVAQRTVTTINFAQELDQPNYVPGSPAQGIGILGQAIYDDLMQFNAQGIPQPFLATSLAPNKSLTAYTMTIPSNIRFADGSKLTAEDIVLDWSQYYEGPGSAAAATFAVVANATAPTKTKVVWYLKMPDGQFPQLLCGFQVFNPDLKALYGSNFGAHPDGTGPFMFTNWVPNSSITLKANPYYWRKAPDGHKLPYLKQINVSIIPDGITRIDAMKAHQIDGTATVQGPVIIEARQAGIKKILLAPAGGAGIFFQVHSAPVDDVRVRTALAYATNPNATIAALGGKKLFPLVTQYFTKGGPYYSSQLANRFPGYDPTKAANLIKEYINDPNRSDHKAVGSPVTIPLETVVGDEQSTTTTQVVQAEWNAIPGIQTQLVPVTQNTEVTNAGTGADTAFYFRWGTSTPYVLFNHNYSNPATDVSNWFKLNDPTIIGAINGPCAAAQTTDELRHCAVLVGQEIVKQVPLIFIFQTSTSYIFNSDYTANLNPGDAVGVDGNMDWASIRYVPAT